MSVREGNHSVLRAKFRCVSVLVGEEFRELTLVPVYGESGSANAQWSKWTPSGELKMRIDNPKAFDVIEVGKEFYLDLTPPEFEKGVDSQIEYVGQLENEKQLGIQE